MGREIEEMQERQIKWHVEQRQGVKGGQKRACSICCSE